MKFNTKIEELYKLVLEADVPPAEPDSQTAGPGPVGDATAPVDPNAPVAPAEPEADTEKLTPEGEVLLIRLIKKALTVKIKPEDLTEIMGLGEINENNAKESLKKLLDIIRRYSEVDLTNT